jgi:transposase InsO family protein
MAIPLKKKNEAGSKLLEVISTLERVTGEFVQEVQADWGKEFQSNEFQGALRQRGIIAKETVPYHSETNALIERVYRLIMAIHLYSQPFPRNDIIKLLMNGGIALRKFSMKQIYSNASAMNDVL